MATKIGAAVIIIGVLGFLAGFMVGGGAQKLSAQYSVGENISVKVKVPGQTDYKTVKLNSGMTVLDAVSAVMPVKTEVFDFGTAVKTIDDKWIVYNVNGVAAQVGMAAYQLKGGEVIDVSLA